MAPQFSVDIVKFWHTGLSSKICLGCAVWLHSMITQCQELQQGENEDLEAMVARTRALLQRQVACIPMTDCHLESNFKQSKCCHVFSTCVQSMKLDQPKKMLIVRGNQKHMRFFFLIRLLNTFWCEHSQSLCVCGVRYLSLSGNACKWKWYCWIRAQWQSREELALGTWLGWR